MPTAILHDTCKEPNKRPQLPRTGLRIAERGIAATQMVMVLAGMMIIIGLEILALSLGESFISGGGVESAKAYRIAEAGARDALMRIARNKKYSCGTVDCYQVEFTSNGCTENTACAKMSVSNGVGTSLDPKIIVSKGIVNNKTRTVQVQVVLDASLHGEIASTTWTELTN